MTLVDFARMHGILIDALPPIGVWRRFKTEDKPMHRNGAVKYMGDHAFVQNHATQLEVVVWRADADAPMPVRDLLRLERQRKAARAHQAQAITSARRYWADSSPLSRPHQYVERKGLTPLGCAGLRINDGRLVIPVMRSNAIISLQSITIEGEKRFWPGAPVKGGAFLIRRRGAALTCLCEGFATGLAIFQSVRNAEVIVAFDAGNLVHVADRLKPTGNVVVCGDNDHRTEQRIGTNPGREKARSAADLIGCGVWWPEGIEGSDAADALKEWGERAARRLEREILAKAQFVVRSAPVP